MCIPSHKKEPVKTKSVAVGTGKAVLGMTAAGALSLKLLISPWEGRVYVPYKDPIGVWTVCDGHTGPDIRIGKVYNDTECDALAVEDVNKHEEGFANCVWNYDQLTDHTKAAFISFTYNNGVARACGSTLAKKVRAGDIKGACYELERWVFAGGRKFQGLMNRRFLGDEYRVSERTMCLIGVDPAYKTPLYEKLYIQFKDWVTDYDLASE